MFNVGDLIIYSAHGICHIDEICEKTYSGVTKTYYVLHPIEDTKLTINTPIDTDKVVMLELIHKDEAEEILESFKGLGIRWEENNTQRPKIYFDIAKNGNRKEISDIINTLMRKKQEAEKDGKKLTHQDGKLLTFLQNTLFNELAIALNTSFEEIVLRVNRVIKN